MAQFTDRKAVAAWLNGHKGKRVQLTRPGTTLRIVATSTGIEELDACSTDIFHGDLLTDLTGVQIGLTLHDDALSLHLLGHAGAEPIARVSLPVSIPYDQVRLEPASAAKRAKGRPKQVAAPEPEFSPYELLHFPRSDR